MEKCTPKSFKKHALTAYMFTDGIREVKYLVNNDLISDSKSGWLGDESLHYYYKKSLNMRLLFKVKELPSRVYTLYEHLIKELTLYLKNTVGMKRVSSSYVKSACNVFSKNVSRMQHNKMFAMNYKRHRRYWVGIKTLNRDYYLHLLDMLEEQGMVRTYEGFKSKGKNIRSLLLVSDELCDSFSNTKEKEYHKLYAPLGNLVVIKDKNKVERKPTRKELQQVKNIERIMKAYNEYLEDRMITINGIEIPEIFFRRVYNGDLNNGGRFYDTGDGIQRHSKSDRRSILIDGEPTISLDFKHLHPSIAAELEGFKLDYDPYICEDVYNLLDAHTEVQKKQCRLLCKRALLIMFNSENDMQAIKALSYQFIHDRGQSIKEQDYSELKGSIPIKEVVRLIKEHNHRIAKYFCSKKGLLFQNLDSKIMEHCIVDHMVDNEVCLPIHDCCIVKRSLKDHTLKLMRFAYKEVLGSDINCIIEEE